MAGRTLTVYLAADTSKFKRGMADAGDGVDGPTGLKGKIGGLAGSLNNMLGPAMLGAGIAAGAMAVKFGVDGVQAAIDERAEIEKLSTALDNLGFGDATASVEEWISAQARSTTFTDSQLRPGLALLAGATGEVKGAQDLLALAMDISVGSGKDLDSVTQGLAKAYAGNTGALKRLIPGITDADLASDDLFTSTGALAERFTGQAAAAQDTIAGKLAETKDAFGELQESFGEGFLSGLGEAEGKSGDLATALYDLQEPIGEVGATVAELLTGFGELVGLLVDGQKAVDDLADSLGPLGKSIQPLINPLNQILGLVQGIGRAADLARSAVDALLGRQREAAAFENGPITSTGGGVFN